MDFVGPVAFLHTSIERCPSLAYHSPILNQALKIVLELVAA